jgi:arylsulfatase A-like enzyme
VAISNQGATLRGRRAAFCAAVLLLAAHWGLAADKPNILVIVADDMGYGDIGVHGCRDIPTPNIDSIASRGIRFRNGYVSGPYCSPTRAGLMTGRYQHRFGHEFNPGETAAPNFGLPLTETTLADRLKAAGYATGMVGKWHLGFEPQFHPLKRGFGSYFGFLGGSHSYLDAREDPENPILRGTEAVDEAEYLTDAFRREALAFVDRNQKSPWFLYWTFNAVHVPMHATPKYLARFSGIAGEGRRTYAAMDSAMDDAIGAMLERIKKLGQERNTLVFFISDNGGPPTNSSSNGPLRGYKAETWEGGIHVPFLLQWRGSVPEGKVYDQPVIQLDILPTALAAAGIPVDPKWKLDGVDLIPFVKGQKPGGPHDALYWRLGRQMAIRMGDWKLVKAIGRGSDEVRGTADLQDAQLFNLAQDLGEKTNLAAQEPEKVKALGAAWMKWSSEMAEPRWFPAGRELRQQKRKKS